MKNVIVFLAVLFISVPAFAVTRDDVNVPSTLVVEGGGEQIVSFGKNLGTSDGDGGSPVQLTATSTNCNEVKVCASADNTNVVYVGGSDIAANWRNGSRIGYPLGTGTSVDRCTTFKVDNVNKVYGIGWASDDYVTVTYTDIN